MFCFVHYSSVEDQFLNKKEKLLLMDNMHEDEYCTSTNINCSLQGIKRVCDDYNFIIFVVQ
jgi:hypothetical protein